jgi:hypothetical protein
LSLKTALPSCLSTGSRSSRSRSRRTKMQQLKLTGNLL